MAPAMNAKIKSQHINTLTKESETEENKNQPSTSSENISHSKHAMKIEFLACSYAVARVVARALQKR